ncbi:hypothetical protein [Vibrio owensii]|uniref:hypothetical protein n=1 Tax=Vibrio owensii TaxID=696485 RepID=UPI000361287F|nr:hypothetical protein [Vibrio owensii]
MGKNTHIGDALLDRKFDITTTIINGEEQTNLHIIPGRRGDVITKPSLERYVKHKCYT